MSLGLSAEQLALMRAQALQLMPDTCVIESCTTASDGAGGFSESWSAAGTVVCRLDALSARTRAEAEMARETHKSYYQLTTPHNSPLATGTRVVCGGATYEVVEVHAAQSWAVTRRARVALIE